MEEVVINIIENVDEVEVIIQETPEIITVHINDTSVIRDDLGLGVSHSPEFANTQITTLYGGEPAGALDDDSWTWLGATAKSVLSVLTALITKTYNLALRVGLLEDKYILKYVVPADCSAIDLTTDRYGNAFNFVEGDFVEIIIQVKAWVQVTDLLNRLNLKINNIGAAIYQISGSPALNYIYTAGTTYKSTHTIIYLTVINNEVQGFEMINAKTVADATLSQYYAINTIGFNSAAITSLNFYKNGVSSLIPAGAVIIIRKK